MYSVPHIVFAVYKCHKNYRHQRVSIGRWLLRLPVETLAILRLMVNIIALLSPEIFLNGELFLRLLVKIWQFLRLTAKFFASFTVIG